MPQFRCFDASLPRRSVHLPRLLLLFAFALAAVPARAAGQAAGAATLRVTVIAAEDGRPLCCARVFVDGLERGTTDSLGVVVVDGVAPGRRQLRIAAPIRGEAAPEVEVAAGVTLEVEVELVAQIPELPVTARPSPFAGSRDVTSRGGRLFTRDRIADANARDFLDLLARLGIASGSTRNAPRCVPKVILDGVRFTARSTEELNVINVQDLEALAWYPVATIPPEFGGDSTGSNCGALVLWTRHK